MASTAGAQAAHTHSGGISREFNWGGVCSGRIPGSRNTIQYLYSEVLRMKTALLVVRVEPEIAEALAQRKDETGVPTSEFVRRAIIQALEPEPVVAVRHAQAAQRLVAACKPLIVPVRKAED